MQFISKTWGTVTEILDLMNSIMNNAEYEGQVISEMSPDERDALIKGLESGEIGLDELLIDWEQVMIDVVMNEVMDRLIGAVSSKAAGEAAKSGTYGLPRFSSHIGVL